jgi:thioredoxin reductase (NADPH)
MQRFDVIFVGQGYAGLKAAKLAAERGLRVATIEKMFPGGLVMSINELWPAPEGEEHSGPDLTSGLAMINMDNGIENVSATVEAVSRGDDGWKVVTDDGTYEATTFVVASGARLRKLGVPGEEDYAGRGVSECADCDGPIFHNKEAVVIGGGDSAFQEAVALTLYASKVTILMRGETPRARQEFVDRVVANDKIVVLSGTQVCEVIGDGKAVTGVRTKDAGSEQIVPCSAIFAFVGLDPSVDFLPADVERDDVGAIVTTDLQTSMPGLWAIGAARSGFGGLLSDGSVDAEKLVAALLP